MPYICLTTASSCNAVCSYNGALCAGFENVLLDLPILVGSPRDGYVLCTVLCFVSYTSPFLPLLYFLPLLSLTSTWLPRTVHYCSRYSRCVSIPRLPQTVLPCAFFLSLPSVPLSDFNDFHGGPRSSAIGIDSILSSWVSGPVVKEWSYQMHTYAIWPTHWLEYLEVYPPPSSLTHQDRYADVEQTTQ